MARVLLRVLLPVLGIAMAPALAALPASAAQAGPAATFDDLPDGVEVSTQYAPALTFGVDLLGHPAGAFPVVARLRSGARVGRVNPEVESFRSAPPVPPTVWGRFGVPAAQVSVRVGTFGSRPVRVTLDAYDVRGNLVVHRTRIVSKGFENPLRVVVPQAVITTFRITGTSLAPLSIDNLRSTG
ncbi:hypothetical protein J5X84_31040 [Streptosporangiaceae bacterium NEAU-GS5]|nr:hypothetical protein [Streptosporangiaceae bacterium NEAU-GS5]